MEKRENKLLKKLVEQEAPKSARELALEARIRELELEKQVASLEAEQGEASRRKKARNREKLAKQLDEMGKGPPQKKSMLSRVVAGGGVLLLLCVLCSVFVALTETEEDEPVAAVQPTAEAMSTVEEVEPTPDDADVVEEEPTETPEPTQTVEAEETPVPEPEPTATEELPKYEATIAVAEQAQRPTSTPDVGSGSMAQVMCEDFVKQNLKAPSTADFGGFLSNRTQAIFLIKELVDTALPDFDTSTLRNEGIWSVTGSVDAENSFGANIRSEFFCALDYDRDADTWHLLEISVDSP